MPYTITTRDGITINNIPDDVAPDSDVLKTRVAAIRSGNTAQPQMVASHVQTPDAQPQMLSSHSRPEDTQEPETTLGGLAGAASRGLAPYAAGAALGAAAGAPAAGIGAIPGAIAGVGAVGLAKLAGDPITSGVNSLLGTNFALPSEALENLMTRIGFQEPKTAAERMVRSAAEGVGGAVGGVGLGQTLAKAVTPAVRGVGAALATQPVAQIAAGAGSGLASQAAQEAGVGPGGQLLAGLAGGVAGGALATKAQPRIQRPTAPVQAAEQSAAAIPEPAAVPAPKPVMEPAQLTETAKTAATGGIGSKSAIAALAEQAMPSEKTLAAAKRLGIEDYLQPDHVSTNQAYRELAQAVKSVPGSNTRAAEIAGLTAIGERADRLIIEMGGRTDLSRLSDSIKNRLGQTVEELSSAANKAYSDIETQIPKNTRGPAANVLQFIEQRATDLDGADNLSSLEKSVMKKLSPVMDEAGNITKQPTYALIDDVRKDIGAATKARGPFADADSGLAKRLYRLIDEDQMALAEQAGQGSSYKAAKELVKVRKGFEDDLISLYGRQLDQSLVGKLESGVTALGKGDAEKIAKLMNSIPKPMRQEVSASALNTAFGKSTKNGQLNFNTFSKWYEGLLQNKQAYAAIMVNLPAESRKKISDLYRVAKNINLATRENITTGRIQAVQQQMQGADTLMENIYGLAKRAAVAAPVEIVTSSVGLPGAGIASAIGSALTRGKPNTIKLADDLISSPQFLALVRSKSAEQSNASAKALASSSIFSRFANASGLPKDPVQRFTWIQTTFNPVKNEQEPE